MVQSPNRKTILAALGVITLGSMAFIGKNFIDGFKEVWVKKREADIQKNLQENLIEVETQSFSGKIQIIRSMLSSKAKTFSDSLSFKGEKKDKNTNDNKLPFLIGGLTLASILALGYFSMRNIRKSDEFITSGRKRRVYKTFKNINESGDRKGQQCNWRLRQK